MGKMESDSSTFIGAGAIGRLLEEPLSSCGAAPTIGYNATAPVNNPEPVAPPPALDAAGNPAATPVPPSGRSSTAGQRDRALSPMCPRRRPASMFGSASRAGQVRAWRFREARIFACASIMESIHGVIAPDDHFTATLYEPVFARVGVAVLPVGTRFRGHLTASSPSRPLRGRAGVGVTLDSFQYQGREYRVDTSRDYRQSGSHKKRNLRIYRRRQRFWRSRRGDCRRWRGGCDWSSGGRWRRSCRRGHHGQKAGGCARRSAHDLYSTRAGDDLMVRISL